MRSLIGRAATIFLLALSLAYVAPGAHADGPASYVGGEVCSGCHAAQAQSWKGSHHAMAMLKATAATVRGDFSGAQFEHFGVTSTFFRDGDKFMAFLFHYSAVITDAAIAGLGLHGYRRVDFRVPQPSTTWLQHPDQLKWAAIEARQAFELAVQCFPRAEAWHVFYAGPAPVAVAVGQQINPTMCPRVQLYEYRHKEIPPYRASILLGG